MKVIRVFLLSLLTAIPCHSQTRITLPGIQNPHFMTIDSNTLYLFDESDYSLHVYSVEPFQKRFTIGKKGEGSEDFQYLPFVTILPDAIACTDFTKTIWYSKNGIIQRIKAYADFADFDMNSEMLLIPAGNNYLRILAEHSTQRRHITLLDSEYRTIKELYNGPFIWRQNEPVDYRTQTAVYGDHIYISDNEKGFFIQVFDQHGKHLKTIDKSDEIDPIPLRRGNSTQDANEVLTHPLLHHFEISEDKIYATTYKTENGHNETIIMDLEGNMLDRFFLPLPSKKQKRGSLRFDLFDIDRRKLFEIVKSEETEMWELLITRLEAPPSQHYRVSRSEESAEKIERMIDVGGRKLSTSTFGSGSPTIVLISGFNASRVYWEPIIPGIAEHATVVTYDRAGIGTSEIGDLPTHGNQSVKDLHTLLNKLDAPKPYIVVGHSFGGKIARLFAAAHPEVTAGLILEDSMSENILEEQRKMLKGKDLQILEDMVSRMRPPDNPRTEGDFRDITLNQVRQSGPLPHIPYVVMVAGSRAGSMPPVFSEEALKDLAELAGNLQKIESELIPGGKFIIVEGASHHIHMDKPEVVVEVILDMVKTIQSEKNPSLR